MNDLKNLQDEWKIYPVFKIKSWTQEAEKKWEIDHIKLVKFTYLFKHIKNNIFIIKTYCNVLLLTITNS